MKTTLRELVPIAAIGFLALAAIARADDDRDQKNAYVTTPLVSNLKGAAAVQDPVLQNAWGVAFTPAGSPFWIADNATGCATLYDGTGVKNALQVVIPLSGNVVPSTSCKHVNPANPPNAAPTGNRLEPDHEPYDGIPRPGYVYPRHFHLRHRGRNDLRLGGDDSGHQSRSHRRRQFEIP